MSIGHNEMSIGHTGMSMDMSIAKITGKHVSAWMPHYELIHNSSH